MKEIMQALTQGGPYLPQMPVPYALRAPVQPKRTWRWITAAAIPVW
jgi:hypothetical protein